MQLNESDFKKLLAINYKLSSIKDIDLLLEKTLLLLRELTHADAGSIYLIKTKSTLSIEFTQNDTLNNNPLKKTHYKNQEIQIDNHSIAGFVANNKTPLNIDDAYLLKNTPYKFNDQFDKVASYRTKSILAIPVLNQNLALIGVIQVINAKNKVGKIIPFSKFDSFLASLFANQTASSIERAKLTNDMIMRMVKLSELRDPVETGQHVKRVAAYSVEIYQFWAQKRGIPAEEIEKTRDILRIATMLHDIGKVAVSDTILKKEQQLEKEEFDHIKYHTIHGARLFIDSYSEWDSMAREICLNHHEKWNGEGYPGNIENISNNNINFEKGKKGKEIPLYARIVAIADVFDALSVKRYYKSSWDDEKIINHFKKQSGNHFDPELVDIFLSILDNIFAIRSKYSI